MIGSCEPILMPKAHLKPRPALDLASSLRLMAVACLAAGTMLSVAHPLPEQAGPIGPLARWPAPRGASAHGVTPNAVAWLDWQPFAPPGAGSTLAAIRPAPAAPGDVWHETTARDAVIVDGRTLQIGDLRLRLEGVGLPAPETLCKRLDGRTEACTIRQATQLELLVRARTLECRYRLLPEGAAGSCKVGTSDLATRLVQAPFGAGNTTVAASDDGRGGVL